MTPEILLKDTHNILRWVVLLTCAWALLRLWSGVRGNSEWTKSDRMCGLVFTSFLNLQVLLGIVLYATSPVTKAAMANFGAAMKDPYLRFFAVEHPTAMLLAAIIAQVGYSRAKRAESDRARFLNSAITYTIAAVLIVLSIPWPLAFLKYARPLFPAFGQS